MLLEIAFSYVAIAKKTPRHKAVHTHVLDRAFVEIPEVSSLNAPVVYWASLNRTNLQVACRYYDGKYYSPIPVDYKIPSSERCVSARRSTGRAKDSSVFMTNDALPLLKNNLIYNLDKTATLLNKHDLVVESNSVILCDTAERDRSLQSAVDNYSKIILIDGCPHRFMESPVLAWETDFGVSFGYAGQSNIRLSTVQNVDDFIADHKPGLFNYVLDLERPDLIDFDIQRYVVHSMAKAFVAHCEVPTNYSQFGSNKPMVTMFSRDILLKYAEVKDMLLNKASSANLYEALSDVSGLISCEGMFHDLSSELSLVLDRYKTDLSMSMEVPK